MPNSKVYVDPEALIREASSAIAVNAFVREIKITTHVDGRLPNRVAPRDSQIGDFLRRGLQRTIESGGTSRIALGFWLDEHRAGGELRAQLEICRAVEPAGAPISRLSDLWALPLEDGMACPEPSPGNANSDSVAIPLRLTSAPGAVPVADQWGGLFRGCSLVDTRKVILDQVRLRASMRAAGMDYRAARAPAEVLECLRGAAAGGGLVVAVFEAGPGDDASYALARRIRSEPALAATRLILVNAPCEGTGAEEHLALFDEITPFAVTRRRVLDVVRSLLQRGRDGSGEPAPPSRAGPAQGGPSEAIPALSSRRILVAEDVETNRMLPQAMLAPTGAAVEMVHDGAQAARRQREAPADLVVMDLQMPGTDGLEALRMIRALDGSAGRVPVVALTAHARKSDRRMALEAGMDAYLTKPIVVADFYRVLRRLLNA
jgi:CheY-like chemotaxis protein